MFFNPLFIDTNSVGSAQNQKNTKLGKSQYLFSDIIKISLAKNESADSETAPSFNLSLVNNGGSINSLFNSGNVKTDKLTSDAESNTQNAEAMLVEFLQYAFINQDIQLPNGTKLQDLMKNKELLLSKESLTNALSQLLQIYQSSGDKETAGKPEVLTPEKLAQQIFASLDDSGKVILNFKNLSSQIKIELTKLNSTEQEQFISTKIIPLLQSSGTAGKTEENGSSALNASTEGKIEVANGLTAESANNSAAGAAVNGKPGNTAENAVNSGKNVIVPVESESAKEKSINKSGEQASGKTSAPVVETNSANNATAAAVTANAASAAKASAQNEQQAEKDGDYKLRVVEINGEQGSKEQETKVYSLSPFEKNVLKKSSITFTSSDSAANKTNGKTEVNNSAKAAGTNAGDSKTITEANNEILKTNNMLFRETSESNKSAMELKQEQVQKENTLNNLKTVSEKTESKILNQQNADSKKTAAGEAGQVKEEMPKSGLKELNDEKDLKKPESTDGNIKQVKQDAAKTAGSTAAVDDNKTKSSDVKKDFNESVKDADKKQNVETEKSSAGSSTDSEKKSSDSSSNSSSPDKKESDSKQFAAQNVIDKEKVNFSKEELFKETSRQAEVTKTIKTYEIIKELKGFIEAGNKNTMILKIVPENLGNVKITLDMTQNMIQGRIDVDNENVKQFVQTNIESLKQTLHQNGVNVGTLSVNVSSSDQKQPRFVSPYKKKGNSFGKEDFVEEAELVTNKKILGYNSYDYLA